jgi:hypothetical protein
MATEPPGRSAAYEFILSRVDSVPQLEALLLLWNSRPNRWLSTDIAQRLYISVDQATSILRDLARQHLIAGPLENEQYFYTPISEEQDRILGWVDATYRRETVAISSMIHSKASRAVRDFARAFRFKKEEE